MSHILEGLNQSPPSVKSFESEAYSNEPEGSQNDRPHFESVPMHIVTIPVHRDVSELVHNKSRALEVRWTMQTTILAILTQITKLSHGSDNVVMNKSGYVSMNWDHYYMHWDSFKMGSTILGPLWFVTVRLRLN